MYISSDHSARFVVRSPRVALWCRAAVWVLALWLGGSPSAWAQGASSCESLLTTAEGRYVQRAFEEAAALVRACLAQSEVEDEEAVQAYRLLALIALRQNDESDAEQAVRELLSIAPGYEPDPVQDPPAYVELVSSVKEGNVAVGEPPAPTDSVGVVDPAPQAEPPAAAEPEIEIVRADPPEEEPPTVERAPAPEREGFTKWVLIGLGAVAASAAAVFVFGNGGSDGPPAGTPLPPPPAFPQ